MTFHGPKARTEHLYDKHAAALERGWWSTERDIAWGSIDAEVARRQPDLLDAVRDAAIIESFHPVNLERYLRATWNDVDAGVVFSLELYEGFRHFQTLRRYLELVGHEPPITDAELVRRREPTLGVEIAPDRIVPALVEFMLSEHLAYYFFRRLSERAEEPVLSDLLRRIAADEVRHAQSASDLLERRIRDDRAIVPRILEAAADFRHYGEEVVGAVPIAEPGDPVAIRTFAERIERLCDTRLVDHFRARIREEA